MADAKGPPDGCESTEVESWLRKAVGASDGQRQRLPVARQLIGGKYRIEEELGRGGMGAVFRAVHVVSDKSVALKWMLRPTSDAGAYQRFTREARAAGRIDHPNVVNVYDIGEDGEAAFLVMELLHGESLRARLARGGLAPDTVVDLLLPAMRGVAAAHREGVIHRDLKPDNIFLCRGPDLGVREAKVLDFGISVISAPQDEAQTTLTKDGMLLGTPAYMSPEQLQSAHDADARTDVYAFGVILYEALTGCVPFQGSNHSALVLAIVNTAPRKPCELQPEIPVELERVVLRAMARERGDRQQDMDALIAALMPFSSERTSAALDSVFVNARRAGRDAGEHASPVFAPRMQQRSLIATAFLAALLMLTWWWSGNHGREKAAASTASPPATAMSTLRFVEPGQTRASPQAEASKPTDDQRQTEAAAFTDAAAKVAAKDSPRVRVAPAPKPKPTVGKRAEPTQASPLVPEPTQPPRGRAGQIRLDDL